MIRDIVKDPKELSKVCTNINIKDPELDKIITDLIDTAESYKDICIGLAANQIGYDKRVILIKNKDGWLPFINPRIIKIAGTKFISSESCLSFEGEHQVTRSPIITITHQNRKGKSIIQKIGMPVSIVFQHEIGHLNGKLI
jgi:peptide deformylase